MAAELVLTFEGGAASGIYADELLPIFDALGPTVTRRASDVEPEYGGWVATMRSWVPGGAVRLGPFPTRAEALSAEVAYLRGVL